MSNVQKFDLACLVLAVFRYLVTAAVVGTLVVSALVAMDVELWRAGLVLALPCMAYLLAWGASHC